MHKRLTLILAGLTMVGPLAIDTYLPSFVAIGQTFNVSQLMVQQSLSVFLFTFAFMMLFYGTLSDSFGRRPIILGSLVVYILASIGAFFAPSLGWLLVARAFQGLSSGAGSVISRAIVQDTVNGPHAQRMLSHIMMVFGLAPAIAPIIGGWLQVTAGWRSIFLFLTLFSTIMFIACYRALPESLAPALRQPFTPRSVVQNYIHALRHPQFLNLALAMSFAFAGGFALYIGSASNFVMNILHLPATSFGWMFIPLIGGMVVGSMFSSKYATRIQPASMVLLGYSIMGVAAVSNVLYNALFTAMIPWAILPLMLYSCGVAIVSPALTVMALDLFPEHKGLASSLQSFIQMMLFALVSGLIAPLLFDSAFKLACGVLAGFSISTFFWRLGLRSASSVQR
ncbi:MAG: multidrug effflux MFS transporter [Pseudomonadota bacterium]